VLRTSLCHQHQQQLLHAPAALRAGTALSYAAAVVCPVVVAAERDVGGGDVAILRSACPKV
jgi:hypothetical protein